MLAPSLLSIGVWTLLGRGCGRAPIPLLVVCRQVAMREEGQEGALTRRFVGSKESHAE